MARGTRTVKESRTERLIRAGLRAGWRRGVVGGSRPWLVAGGLALSVRVLRKLIGAEERLVYSETLLPGEAIVIEHERTRPRR